MKPKTNTETKLKVLVLEDSIRDLKIMREQLLNAGFRLELTHVENEAGFTASLSANRFDLILSDFSLPGFDAFGALKISKKLCPETPFICVSGSIGEETAVEILRLGAVDYVLKDRPERLPFAVKQALAEAKIKADYKKAEEALQESEAKFRFIAENSIDCIWQMDNKLRFTYVSPSVYRMTGYTQEEWVGTKLSQHATFKEFMQMARKAVMAIKNHKSFQNITFEAVMLKKDGSEFPVEISSKVIYNERGFPIGLQGTTRDITEQKQAEEKLANSHQRLRFALQGGELGMWDWNPQDSAVIYSDIWAQMLEYKPDEVEPNVEFFKRHIHPEDLAEVLDRLTEKGATAGI
jgi:PAS domain S-box-containing protein